VIRYHFKYSAAQIAQIEAALSARLVSSDALKDFQFSLSICINALELNMTDELRRFFTENAADTIAAIERLYELNSRRIGEEQDRIGRALEKALPYLKEVHWLSRREIDSLAWFDIPKESNNKRPFPRKLMKRTSDAWRRFGGQVNHGSEYRRFFEAVVRPVMDNSRIQREHGCAWTDGMFRTHVTEYMRHNDIKGARGKPRQRTRPVLKQQLEARCYEEDLQRARDGVARLEKIIRRRRWTSSGQN
jgi:hypothetical protein